MIMLSFEMKTFQWCVILMDGTVILTGRGDGIIFTRGITKYECIIGNGEIMCSTSLFAFKYKTFVTFVRKYCILCTDKKVQPKKNSKQD